MSDTKKWKKRWFLKIELVVLLGVVCIWLAKSEILDIAGLEAGGLKQVVEIDRDDLNESVVSVESHNQESEILESQYKEYLKSQEIQQLADLDLKLKRIEQYAPRQRQNIENWYASNLANLQQWAEEWLKQLEGEERVAWARCLQGIRNEASETTGYVRMDSHGYADTHFNEYGYATTNSYIITDGYFSEDTHTFVVGNPVGEYESEQYRIDNSREAIRSEFVKLKRKREKCLAELEFYVQNVKAIIYANKWAVHEDTEIKLSGGPGLIQAISISDNEKPFVIMFNDMFNDELFYEGSIINGFKIRKIDANKTEFEKNGEIWVQPY